MLLPVQGKQGSETGATGRAVWSQLLINIMTLTLARGQGYVEISAQKHPNMHLIRCEIHIPLYNSHTSLHLAATLPGLLFFPF
jgi:hypothetical protein